MNKSTHFFFAAMFAFALALTLVQSRAFLAVGPVPGFFGESGNILYTEHYRPYGERLQNAAASQSAQPTGNRQWFQGKVQDESTGLQYFGARYYDPAIGRFMGVDAAGFDENNIQSFNHYAYANNNPYRYTDPDGNFAFLLVPIGWVVGGAAVGAITDGAINAVAQYAATGSIRMQGAGGVLDAMGEGAQIGAILGPVVGAERAAAKIGVAAGVGVAKGATNWGNPNTLARHFRDHGGDFGAKSADDYAAQSSQFFRRSQADKLPTKIDADGVIRVYDPKTNTFGSFNPDGTTKTFFKPTSPTYWDRQPGSAPWIP